MTAASTSFPGYIGLATGAANLIQVFGDQKLKDMFLPKLFNGEWGGTMALTEPTAGSDVGDILSKAYPTDDPVFIRSKGTRYSSRREMDSMRKILSTCIWRE